MALPLRLFDLGFLPPDDSLRYAARAVSGKTWNEIILMRPEITIDHNAGWNWLQGVMHRLTGWSPKQLVLFSLVLTFAVFSIIPLFWFRRPESWVASLALLMFIFPYFAERLFVGRPLWLTATVALVLLCLWKEDPDSTKLRKILIVSSVLVAVSGWIHGSWYLLGLVPATFAVGRRWRASLCLTFCWLAGSVFGALFTGHPWKYLYESALIPFLALDQTVPPNALVGEFQPFTGGYFALVIIALLLGLRSAGRLPMTNIVKDPMLALALIGWLLGAKVFRFWLDWGLPALALWIAFQLQDLLGTNQRLLNAISRCAVSVAAALLLFVGVADNKENRWSNFSQFEAMDEQRAEHAEWLPDKNGILYSVNMSVFYETFFTNPLGDWRYALGFEPSFMHPEDYAVFRELWQTLNAVQAVQPWVNKMTPADRLVLLGPSFNPPAIPQLEWKYVIKDTWVGRLPREDSPPKPIGPNDPAL